MQTLLQRLTSRKFLISIIAGLIITFGENFGIDLDPEQVAGLVGVVAAFVTGEAVIDKQRVSALVASEVEQFKVQANTYVASLQKKLESLQAEAPDA
jgi:hypothetical protein